MQGEKHGACGCKPRVLKRHLICLAVAVEVPLPPPGDTASWLMAIAFACGGILGSF
jgi:hypothetical protein